MPPRRRKYSEKEKAAYYRRRRAPASRRPRKNQSSFLGRAAGNVGRSLLSGAGSAIGRTIGTAIGGAPIGTYIGGLIGGAAGSAGSFIKRKAQDIGTAALGEDTYIKYFGDYETIKSNSFLKDEAGNMPPIINKDPGGGVLIRRSEYITDIISGSAGTFNLQNFFINPGQAATFPWLSQIAPNFEEWVVEGMYFEYRTMSADALNSTNTALGQVIMAANYNAASPNFTSKQPMENYEGGVSCKPSCSMRYFVECAKNQTILDELYVRPGAVPPAEDQRLYDLANFQIATNGLQASNVNLGELWVTYQISLRKPKMFASLGFGIDYGYWGTAGYTNAAPMGNTTWTSSDVAATLTSQTFTGTGTTFYRSSVKRAYYITIYWQGTAATFTLPTASGSTGVTIDLVQNSPQVGGSTTYANGMWLVTINENAVNPTFTLSGGGSLPTSVNASQIIIMQVPSNA